MVITPDKVLYSAEVESGQYYWIFNVGSGGYGGVTWDNRGVSTPAINYHSINIDLHSIANILHNGNAHASQIETYYIHGVTPPAFGWMYQGHPAGTGHIAIVYSWGESSATYQSTANPIGVTPRCRPDTTENIFNIEYSGWITDYSRGNHSSDFSLGEHTPCTNRPEYNEYEGYRNSRYFYDCRVDWMSADGSSSPLGVLLQRQT